MCAVETYSPSLPLCTAYQAPDKEWKTSEGVQRDGHGDHMVRVRVSDPRVERLFLHVSDVCLSSNLYKVQRHSF